MSAPLVTVLLPVYNSAATLVETLTSLRAQTFGDFEVLVIDDGSSDASPEILQSWADPRLRVLRNERNLGLMRSLNRGLREARGEWIARQDSDDLSAPDRLARQIDWLKTNPNVQLLGASCWRMNPQGRVTGSNDLPTSHEALRWASVLDNPFIHTSVVFRRQVVLEEFGGYNEAFPICEDYELWNRIAARYRVANLRERLVYYREHASSMMQSQPEAASRAMHQLLTTNLASVFPGRPFTAEEIELLSLFRLRFDASRVAPLCTLLNQLEEEYHASHPEAAASADFGATLCRQHLRLAYKFLSAQPAFAFGQIAEAVAVSPGEWLRQAAQTVLGRIGFRPTFPEAP